MDDRFTLSGARTVLQGVHVSPQNHVEHEKKRGFSVSVYLTPILQSMTLGRSKFASRSVM